MTDTVSIIPMSETQLQSAVIEMAQTFKWRVAHFRAARVVCPVCRGQKMLQKKSREHGWRYDECAACKSKGYTYRTPVEADGQGFLDLFMARPPRIVITELKVKNRKLIPEQQVWFDILEACPGVEVYRWTDKDWNGGAIERVLR